MPDQVEVDVEGGETLGGFLARHNNMGFSDQRDGLNRLRELNDAHEAVLVLANLDTRLLASPTGFPFSGLGITSLKVEVEVSWFDANKDQLRLGAESHREDQTIFFACIVPNGVDVPQDVNTQGWTHTLHDWEMQLWRGLGDTVYWRYDCTPTQPLAPFANQTRDLLTYETAFNMPQFRRTNQPHDLGAFAIAIDRVRVWMREGISSEMKECLLNVFFPQVASKALLGDTYYADWSWKNDRRAWNDRSPSNVATARQLCSSRGHSKLYLPGFALFPYNYRDNSNASRAIGTAVGDRNQDPPLFRVDGGWTFWRTASRSTFCRLEPLTTVAEGMGSSRSVYSRQDATPWPHDQGEDERSAARERRWDELLPDDQPGYEMQHRDEHDFGVKTGVNYIGTNNQPTKDTLEALNVRACLRSDYVALVDANVGGLDTAEAGLKIQTELLTVTTRPVATQPPQAPPGYRGDDYFPAADGFQVRDLTIFDIGSAKRFYFPPLSMPYVDTAFDTRRERWSDLHANQTAWEAVWRRIYARPVAHAKVLALLRYGFQHLAPHGQNLVLELNRPEQEGPADITCSAAIIRDLGDVQLHPDVTEALWRGDPAARAIWSIIEFEVPPPGERGKWTLGETGSAEALAETVYQSDHHNTSYGAGQVNLQWVTMSAIIRPTHVRQAQGGTESQGAYDLTDYDPRWRQLLASMAALGIEHQRAFVECFERQLGVMLPQVDWDAYSDPTAWSTLGLTDVTGAVERGKDDHKVEVAVGAVLHEFLRSSEGANAVRAYRTRRWEPSEHTVQITVSQNGQPLPYARVRITPTPNLQGQLDPQMWVTPTGATRVHACACECAEWDNPWANDGYRAEVERLFAKRDGVRWTDAQGKIRLYGPTATAVTATVVGGVGDEQVEVT